MPLSFLHRRLPAGLYAAAASSLLLSACFNIPGMSTKTAEGPTSTVAREPATVASGRPLIVQRTAADDRTVAYLWQQEGQFVRIETSEPGAAPHRHPVTLSRKQVEEALAQVHVDGADGPPVFTDEAMNRLAAPLAEALGRASPDQEITFAVAAKPPGFGGLFTSRVVTTGRLYHEADGLNLIIGLLQTSFEEKMLATGQRIAFTPGSHQHRIQEGWSLGTDALVTQPKSARSDWVLINPTAWTGGPVAATAAPMVPATVAGQSPEPMMAPAPPRQTNKYRTLEERLEVLKRLRDKGLISEDAYEEKNRQILDEL